MSEEADVLTADPERVALGGPEPEYGTGILVRAKLPGGALGPLDIVQLDKASLLRWLRSRGGQNEWAENVVGVLLGHGHLHAKADAGELLEREGKGATPAPIDRRG